MKYFNGTLIYINIKIDIHLSLIQIHINPVLAKG